MRVHRTGLPFLTVRSFGNKRHFPFLEFEGIKIVSPAELVRILIE